LFGSHTGIKVIIFVTAIVSTFIAAFSLINIDALINWLPQDQFDLIKKTKLIVFLVSTIIAAVCWFITYVYLKEKKN
jgi:fructose-specific phosphotransferase system IIC component